MAISPTARSVRTEFFTYLFGEDQEGYLCIATASKKTAQFRQHFFRWPNDRDKVSNFIDGYVRDNNIWFCTSLLERAERKKDACISGSLVWSDLDYVPDPDKIEPPPSCLVESSPSRYQAYWRLEQEMPPDVQEDFSRRLAYQIRADKSGWDLTQLLRVPYTFNMKYVTPHEVMIHYARETLVPVEVFDELPDPELPHDIATTIEDMPAIEGLPDVKSVIYAYRFELQKLSDNFLTLFNREPPQDADWSRMMWRLINLCSEIGMTKEEMFVIALNAKCNKYERDNRPTSYLWREIVKASTANDNMLMLLKEGIKPLEMPRLIDEDEIEEDSLVLEYKKWGEVATDAPLVYHELSCFIALSSLICGGLRLKTSFGDLFPNLWGLILGESTLTRKTTAMRMAMDIVLELDKDAILASDGSPEGIITGLGGRPSRVSIFYKDEVSGFFDSINRKDYMAGLRETFTQLYDVPKVLTRLLRKDTVTITEPYFIFFGGGIRDKVYSLVSEEDVLSGFLPRFLVVSGENDLERVRRTGPPTKGSEELKTKVVEHMMQLKEFYSVINFAEVGGERMMLGNMIFDAKMDQKAWDYFGDLEQLMIRTGAESGIAQAALPTFQRLAFSMLKMAMLVAAARREPDLDKQTLEVTKDDIKQAAWYIQRWGYYTIDLVTNAGRPNLEKILTKILEYITLNQGCVKSTLMNRMKFNSKETREYLETLQERGLITVKNAGKSTRLYTVV